MKGDKATAGLLLIGPAKPKKEEDDGEDVEGGGKLAATKALVKALGLKPEDADLEAVDEALTLHYDLCAMSAEDDEDDGEYEG